MTQNSIAEKGREDAAVNCAHYFEYFLPNVAPQTAFADFPLDVTIGLNITGPGGGQWSVVLGGGQVVVRRGAPRGPHITYSVDQETFGAVVRGRLTPQDAFLARRIEIAGDIEKGLVLAALFGTLVGVFPYQDTITPEAMDANPVLV
jgi:putative sterol carrier protein